MELPEALRPYLLIVHPSLRRLAEPEVITHHPVTYLELTEALAAAAYIATSAMMAGLTALMDQAQTAEMDRALLQESLARIPELSIAELVELQTIQTHLHQVEEPEAVEMEPVGISL